MGVFYPASSAMVRWPLNLQILLAANFGGIERSRGMKNNRKLQLNKETIRNLSDESLDQVAGGKKKSETGGICVSLVKQSACVACGSAICDSVAICQSVIC